MKKLTLLLAGCAVVGNLQAQNLDAAFVAAEKVNQKVIEWRHHIHQNPELSNREYNTAKMVAKHLVSLGMEVKTEVAKTGVVGILKGEKPGPVIALRADMDALPVTERVDLAWASKAVGTYNGQETGVMHACGHDTHVAMLMGVAEVLAGMKQDIKGTIKFIFQPAEEGPPSGESGGAKLMVEEGVLKNPDVEVIFGLHIDSQAAVGDLTYKPGGTMAAADRWVLKVKGVQSHGSTPWTSVDPIVTSALIINGYQTIVSRQINLTNEAAVLTVGLIQGGVRNNIIPEEVVMIGTLRTLDVEMQDFIHERMQRTAEYIAASQGATVELAIDKAVPITFNDLKLTDKAVGWLKASVKPDRVLLVPAETGAEDFSFFANEVPGFYFFVGGCPTGDCAPHHTPDFYVDDAAMLIGMKAMLSCAFNYPEDRLD